jgi:hypothetical protein
MGEFSQSQLDVLRLVADDGTPFGTLSAALTPGEAQTAVRDLWRRGLVAIERVDELHEAATRAVSPLTPDVRSTSRLVQQRLEGNDAEIAVNDEHNWRHLTVFAATESWYEVTSTPGTEAAYLAAWAEHGAN